MENRSLLRESLVSGGAVARWLIGLAVGSLLGLTLILPNLRTPGSAGEVLAEWIPFVALGLLWLYPIIIVHEGGHLLASRLVGFSLVRCFMGPLKITRTRQGLRFQLSKERLFSGSVLVYPPDDGHLRRRLAIIDAGGPLANLLLAGLAWWLGSVFRPDALSTPFTMLFFPSLVFFSGLVGIDALIPYRGRRYVSDGLHIFRVLWGGRSGEREVTFYQMMRFMLSGARPRDWPGALVLRNLALAETPDEQHAACVIAYSWALGSGNVAGAGAYLDQALTTLPAPAKPHPILALEVAYFEARHRARLDAARLWLKYTNGSAIEQVLLPRAEMAILLREGRYEEALARAAQGLAACEHEAPKTLSGLRTEEEQLREMAAEAQQAKERVL